ncbi:hypothetical protein ZIOFF_020379 [Zingiber officinale]|uniref:At2g35280-like TPR domain-containing protein n=1 Tax=Zingiber officinale TaxID=94328 RepID=A0A8J5H9S6_ZINOF|nr:hypothetical protein ZIOFF_020379 [Zingiber officinale]
MTTTGNVSVTSLPHDLTVELFVRVASTSSTPRRDLKRLRESCKDFHEASRAKKVGKFMHVRRELELCLNWFDRKEYLELLRGCARCDNLDACFILGLEEIFNSKEKTVGLSHLQKAKMGEHPVAAYVLGMLLFSEPETRPLAVRVLSELAAAEKTGGAATSLGGCGLIRECRREAAATMRDMTWVRPERVELVCPNRQCGRAFGTHDWDLWLHGENRSFCSNVCRWRHEANLFANS